MRIRTEQVAIAAAVGFGVATIVLIGAMRSNPLRAPQVTMVAEPEANEARDAAADAAPSARVAVALDASEDAPRSRFCDDLRNDTIAELARASATFPSCAFDAPEITRTCVSTPHATWGFRVDHAVGGDPNGFGRDRDCDSRGYTVSLVHVDASGTEASIVPVASLQETWKLEAGNAVIDVSMAATWGSLSLRTLAVFDYDGDDDPEILLAGDAADEGPDRSVSEAWTFKGGAIVPYAPLASFADFAVEDVDNDGRPDLLTRGPYEQVEAASALGSSYPAAPAIFAYHSLSNGSFSVTDAEARAYAKSECPKREPLRLVTETFPYFDDGVARNVVCAKLWGTSAGEVTRAWDAACKGWEAGGLSGTECEEWPKALGDVAPPFLLTP